METDCDDVKILLREKIIELCRDTLQYKKELKVQGMLGITLDEEDILLISFDTAVSTKKRRQLPGQSARDSGIQDLSLDSLDINYQTFLSGINIKSNVLQNQIVAGKQLSSSHITSTPNKIPQTADSTEENACYNIVLLNVPKVESLKGEKPSSYVTLSRTEQSVECLAYKSNSNVATMKRTNPTHPGCVKVTNKPHADSVKLTNQSQPDSVKLTNQPHLDNIKVTNQLQPDNVKITNQLQSVSVELTNQPQPDSVKLTSQPQPESVNSLPKTRRSLLINKSKESGTRIDSSCRKNTSYGTVPCDMDIKVLASNSYLPHSSSSKKNACNDRLSEKINTKDTYKQNNKKKSLSKPKVPDTNEKKATLRMELRSNQKNIFRQETLEILNKDMVSILIYMVCS